MDKFQSIMDDHIGDLMQIQDMITKAQDSLQNAYSSGVESALKSVGLQRKEPTVDLPTVVGLFAAGLVVGASLSLLLAPKSGKEMRRSVKRALPIENDDYDLPRYDFENDRFRHIKRPRRSHRR